MIGKVSWIFFQWEKWRDPIEETYWLSERQISFQHRRNGQWKHRKETEASGKWKSILLRNGVPKFVVARFSNWELIHVALDSLSNFVIFGSFLRALNQKLWAIPHYVFGMCFFFSVENKEIKKISLRRWLCFKF